MFPLIEETISLETPSAIHKICNILFYVPDGLPLLEEQDIILKKQEHCQGVITIVVSNRIRQQQLVMLLMSTKCWCAMTLKRCVEQ